MHKNEKPSQDPVDIRKVDAGRGTAPSTIPASMLNRNQLVVKLQLALHALQEQEQLVGQLEAILAKCNVPTVLEGRPLTLPMRIALVLRSNAELVKRLAEASAVPTPAPGQLVGPDGAPLPSATTPSTAP